MLNLKSSPHSQTSPSMYHHSQPQQSHPQPFDSSIPPFPSSLPGLRLPRWGEEDLDTSNSNHPNTFNTMNENINSHGEGNALGTPMRLPAGGIMNGNFTDSSSLMNVIWRDRPVAGTMGGLNINGTALQDPRYLATTIDPRMTPMMMIYPSRGNTVSGGQPMFVPISSFQTNGNPPTVPVGLGNMSPVLAIQNPTQLQIQPHLFPSQAISSFQNIGMNGMSPPLSNQQRIFVPGPMISDQSYGFEPYSMLTASPTSLNAINTLSPSRTDYRRDMDNMRFWDSNLNTLLNSPLTGPLSNHGVQSQSPLMNGSSSAEIYLRDHKYEDGRLKHNMHLNNHSGSISQIKKDSESSLSLPLISSMISSSNVVSSSSPLLSSTSKSPETINSTQESKSYSRNSSFSGIKLLQGNNTKSAKGMKNGATSPLDSAVRNTCSKSIVKQASEVSDKVNNHF